MTSVRNSEIQFPSLQSLVETYSITRLLIYLFLFLQINETHLSFFPPYVRMTILAHSHTRRTAVLLRHSIWRYKVAFPKQHRPKLWQFAGRTLIAVAGAQVSHAKHSAAKSVIRVYECVCLWVRVCICLCVRVRASVRWKGGAQGVHLLSSAPLHWYKITLIWVLVRTG